MFGCHNCQVRPPAGTPYEESPCAVCRTCKDTPAVSHFREDPATYDRQKVEHPAQIGTGEYRIANASDCGPTVLQVEKNDLDHVLQALAKSVRVLISMKENFPQTYRILDAKMSNPNLSYTELAEQFSCRKQNVQYHLKKAVSLCPELSSVLIIDSRFSSGYTVFRENRRRYPKRQDSTLKMKGDAAQ